MENQPLTVSKKSFFTRGRIILLVVLIGFLLRLWAAWQLPVDYDEPIYLDDGYQYARLIQAGDINGIIDYSGTSEHPPLVKILYGLTILALGRGAAFNQALFLTRLVSVVFGTLAVAVVAIIDPLAGGLVAVQTLLVKYTSQTYLEAVPLFFGLLAIYALRKSTPENKKWFILSAIALGICGAGKYSYFPFVFVLLYIMIWEKRMRIANLVGYLVLAGLVFWLFNPYLWHDPLNRLISSLSYHAQYSQGAHVQEVGYPWYQPFLWISRSFGFIWHPEIFFYLGFDGLIFLLALPGIWRAWISKRWMVVWIVTSMIALLLWPTKWPQYTLVVLPAFCLASSTGIVYIYEKLKEQEIYWEWFHNMFPRPTRKYIILASILMGLLVVGALVSEVLIAINKIGWSDFTVDTSGLPNNKVNDIFALPDGRLLIGTDSGAVIWKAASDKQVQDEWTVYTPENSSIPSLQVLAVTEDRAGVLWFGTASGLARLNGDSWTVYHAADFGLQNELVDAMTIDSANDIWIGTQGGAAEFDGNSWNTYTTGNSDLVDDHVFSLATQSIGNDEFIWFGTLNGVSALDLKTNSWRSFTRQELDLGWGGISDLMVDSSGRLWVCTEGGGIYLWDGKEWTSIKVSNSKLPYSTVENVTELEPGVFWIAASVPNNAGGVLAKYDGTIWRIYKEGLSGYSGAETVTMAKDSSGRYWFGTRTDGINLFEPRK